ncbi:MAG: glycerate kinase, partial [Planctomycetes bacterium]|nr:glycerate kinase [Planctomycetota bacterium]
VFCDADGKKIADGSGGGALASVASIDVSNFDRRMKDVEIIIACDVDNPVVGAEGSAEIFAPQKGANEEQVRILAAGLNSFFSVVDQTVGIDVRHQAGAGAAGSIAGSLMALCGGRLEGGFELWQQYSNFSDKVKAADLLITGEGRMDEQTIHGKGPMGAAIIAKEHQLAVIAIVGGLAVGDDVLHQAGIDVVFPLCAQPMSLDQAIADAAGLLSAAACRAGYALQLMRS